MIHHQLDYILTLIDPVTDGPVVGPNRFFIDGIAIKASKQIDNQFLFVNLLNNPKYVHIMDKTAAPTLTWHNPHYKTVCVTLEASSALHRPEVSMHYPFTQGQTLIELVAKQPTKVVLKVPVACGRYRTNGAEKGSCELYLSAAKTKKIVGRQFIISEAEHSERIIIHEEKGLCQLSAPLENSYSEEAHIEEIMTLCLGTDESALIPLKAFDKGVDQVTVDLVYGATGVEKPLSFEVLSGVRNSVILSE